MIVEPRRLLAEQGYVLVEDVVPAQLCRDVVAAISSFLSIDPDEPASFRETGEPVNGVVPIHQHAALWAVRQHPRVHEVFAELLETEALWVTMDRCGFKPPRPGAPEQPNCIHLDKDPGDPSGPIVQGLVYLTDTPVDQAAFECVPSLYREIVAGARPDFRADPLPIGDREVVRAGGEAGSLLVWSTMLPHGSGHNRGSRPRFTQYVSMYEPGDEAARRERIELFRTSRAPSWWRDIEGQLDPEPWPPAELTLLGQRLLGLEPWPRSVDPPP